RFQVCAHGYRNHHGGGRGDGDRGCRDDTAAFVWPGRQEHSPEGLPAAALVALVVPARPSTARRCLGSPPARTTALSPLSRYVPDLRVGCLLTLAIAGHNRSPANRLAGGVLGNMVRRRFVAVGGASPCDNVRPREGG